ncbi:MAG: hypothetical protein AAGK78_15330, partial [Planctomycetota bacterium]
MLLPAIVGGVIVMTGVAQGNDTELLVTGAALLGIAVGAVLTGIRWLRYMGKDAPDPDFKSRRPRGDLLKKSTGVTADQLNDLELRAKVRGDFDTAGLVDRLQPIQVRLRKVATEAKSDALDLIAKLDRLFESSAESLERALKLHLASREMVTQEGRDTVVKQREQLLSEVGEAVKHTETAIDRLRASSAVAGDADRSATLKDLAGDLDRQLEVARRVEARMAELEAKASGDYSASEAY